MLTIFSAIAYYQYSMDSIPAEVAESQETILNVDTIRFTFKVSLLAQKGLSQYLTAIGNQDEDQL